MCSWFRLAWCLSALTAPGVLADEVGLKNGDRLSGKILRSDGKVLVLKTDSAGEVNVQWTAVASVTSQEPLCVTLTQGRVVAGVVTAAGSAVQVATAEAGTVSVPWGDIVAVRSPAEQQAYEAHVKRYSHPRLTDLWAGFVDLGFARTQGNADTASITLSANANRATPRDTTSLRFTSTYASSHVGGRSTTTANFARGGIGHSRNVNPKLHAFGSLDLEFDQFQSLDLRVAPASGFGYHMLKQEATSHDLLGGVSLNREYFSTGLRRTSGEALLGQELSHRFNQVTRLTERLVVFPNLTIGGAYRLNFDTSLATTLRKWLAWQVTVSDRYLSNPVAGRRKNDVLFTTGLRLTFTR